MSVLSVVSFSIRGSEVFPREPYLRVWESREGQGTLYGLVEVVEGPPQDVAAVVWSGVEAALQESRLTVTRYLQNALVRAHQRLSEYGARGWRAGATVLTVRGDDVYLAWAGPSVAYVLTGGHLVRPGAASEETHGAGPALGEGGGLVPHVAHRTTGKGDVLLVAWSTLHSIASEDALATLLATGVENCSQSLFRLVSGQKEFAVLVAGVEASSGAGAP